MEISSSSIPKNMPSIPNDVIFEILSWAPANSVLRFRWACKYWFDLIKDSKFVKMHFLHHSTTTITTTHEDDYDDQFINNTCLLMDSFTSRALYSMRYRDIFDQSSPKKIKMDFYDCINVKFYGCLPPFHLTFLGSCNGLIYFQYYYHNCHERVINGHFIWNPSTRELKELPQVAQPNVDDIFLPAFDVLGFGYDHTIDDYKVIKVEYYVSLDIDQDTFEEHYYCERKINVYTLGSNSWSEKVDEITDYCYNAVFDSSSGGLFVNGALHWIMRSSWDLVSIISFDMAKEDHGELQLPDNLANIFLSRWESVFQVLNGYLVIFCINGQSDDKEMDVWMMKDYGVKDSWTKLFTVNMKQLLKDISLPLTSHLCYLKLLKYHKDGRVLMVCNGKYIIIYDLKKEKRSKLIRYNVHRIEDDVQFENLVVGETYIETLVSLNSSKYLTVAGSRTTTFQKHKREDEDLKKK